MPPVRPGASLREGTLQCSVGGALPSGFDKSADAQPEADESGGEFEAGGETPQVAGHAATIASNFACASGKTLLSSNGGASGVA